SVSTEPVATAPTASAPPFKTSLRLLDFESIGASLRSANQIADEFLREYAHFVELYARCLRRQHAGPAEISTLLCSPKPCVAEPSHSLGDRSVLRQRRAVHWFSTEER